jgi:hypothetical protein
MAGTTLGPTQLTYNDDLIAGWNGVGPQLDGFGHIGIDNIYYNCNNETEIGEITGLTKLGIETVPAIATRGIVLDMAGLMGVDIVKEVSAVDDRKEPGGEPGFFFELAARGRGVRYSTSRKYVLQVMPKWCKAPRE